MYTSRYNTGATEIRKTKAQSLHPWANYHPLCTSASPSVKRSPQRALVKTKEMMGVGAP